MKLQATTLMNRVRAMGEDKNIIGQLFINGQPLTVIGEIDYQEANIKQ